jgi:hypothetical protein
VVGSWRCGRNSSPHDYRPREVNNFELNLHKISYVNEPATKVESGKDSKVNNFCKGPMVILTDWRINCAKDGEKPRFLNKRS